MFQIVLNVFRVPVPCSFSFEFPRSKLPHSVVSQFSNSAGLLVYDIGQDENHTMWIRPRKVTFKHANIDFDVMSEVLKR